MIDQFGICKPCCGCSIQDITGPMTVCSGNYLSGNFDGFPFAWKTSDDNALLRTNRSAGSGQPWEARAVMSFFRSGALGGERWVFRVVGGLLDCNNYCYFEKSIENLGPDPEIPFNYLISRQHRLVNVVDGDHEELAIHPHSPTIDSRLTWSDGGILQLCWDGVKLLGWEFAGLEHGLIGFQPDATLSNYDYVPLGSRAGVATGDCTKLDRMVLSEFDFKYGQTLAPHRALCNACGNHCCLGTVPAALVAEITGSGLGTYNPLAPPAFTNCVGECDDVLGTFPLPAVDIRLLSSHGGDSWCQWYAELSSDPLMCPGAPTPIALPHKLRLLASVNALGAGPRLLTLQAHHFIHNDPHTINSQLGRWSADVSDLACKDWNDWIYLTPVVDANTVCPTTSARIKKAV